MIYARFTVPREELRGDFEALTEYQDQPGGVAMVLEARANLEEITEAEYVAELAAIRAHNAAIPDQAPAPPPARKTRAEIRADVEAANTLAQLKAAVLELLDG